MSRRRLAMLALAGLYAACDGDPDGVVPDAAPPDATPIDADLGAVPRVEPAACRFTVPPSLELTEGADYACGDLVVEENRAAPGRRIRLHYIRVASTATTNRATIYLDGGPGGDGQGILDRAANLGAAFLTGLLADGDFLVIGQRGTSRSLPYLECSSESCYDGLVDLPSYNTAANADDVDDLRSALGLDKLNLYGISYGSRLGLEVLRRHGDHVRAAVLEGLVPAHIVWPAAMSASFYSALTSLDASCADASACATSFGDLVAKFTAGVDALNADPVSIEVSGSSVPVDGYSYAYMLFRMLYARSTYPWLPLLINDFAVRRTDRVSSYVATWAELDRREVARGLYYSIVCGELYNPPDPNAVDAANANVPTAIRDLFDASYYSLQDTCSTWPKGTLQAALAEPVSSSVPTLVSSGRLDPITPPSFGDATAATLSNATVVVHENSGHGATLQSECGAQNLHAFVSDPMASLDSSCAASITTSYVVPGMFTSPAVPWARIRAELATAPMPPFMLDRMRRLAPAAR